MPEETHPRGCLARSADSPSVIGHFFADGALLERRKDVRFPLHVPVSFSWQDESGAHRQQKGSTRDISVKGAFVFAPACPPEGAAVNLEILLPSISDAAPSLQVRADAQVLRVEEGVRENARNGFAVKNQKTFFLREGEIIEDEAAEGSAPEP